MKIEINVPTTINIVDFAEALRLCADTEILANELASYNLPNSEQGVKMLCLHLSPNQIVNNVLERKKEVVDICSLLDIELQPDDNREVMVARICTRITNTNFPFGVSSGTGFRILNKYVKQAKDENTLRDKYKAGECANKLELLIKDMYSLFVGNVLIRYLEGRERKTAEGILKAKAIKFGTQVSQLSRIEEHVKRGKIKFAKDELEKISGNSSIFPNSDLKIVQQVSTIRGMYIAHGYPDSNLVKRKSQELFDLVEQFTESCMDAMPLLIFPIHFGINEWGVRYIAYIDEADLDTEGKLRTDISKVEDGYIRPEKCKRLYLLENYADFRPYQKAYCLYPYQSSIMCDPRIFYKDDLDKIAEYLG